MICKGLQSREQFLGVQASFMRWSGEDVPEKVGMVKLIQAVTLLPKQEYLLWGRLPNKVPMSPGSTAIVESSTGKCVMVGRVITSLWEDGWTPVRVSNITVKPLTLRRNSKLANVSPCVAVEDISLFQGSCQKENASVEITKVNHDDTDFKQRLQKCSLVDVDMVTSL